MYVQDVMQTAVTTVTPHTTVSTAYQMMTRRGARIRHLPVVAEEGTLIGIVTDRDVRRALASDAPSMAEHELPSLLAKLHVREIMTTEVLTVNGTTSVVARGTLVGIVTEMDCLRAFLETAPDA